MTAPSETAKIKMPIISAITSFRLILVLVLSLEIFQP